jgi:hypothetical protein
MTTMSLRWRSLVVVAVLLLVVPLPTGAQKTTLPPNLIAPSRNLKVVGGQLRMAEELGRRTLAGLHSASLDGAVPIDEGVVQAARDAYVLIRAARAGLEQAKAASRFGDPIVDYVLPKVTDAWNLARTPADQISWAHTRQRYLEISIRDLSQAVAILEQVVVLLP